MLEFEVTGDRNNFIELQTIFNEVDCKINQSSGAALKNDAAAAADKTNFYKNLLHSLFSDSTVSANGLKISNASGNFAFKNIVETEFSHNKDAKNPWPACQGYSYDSWRKGGLSTTELNRRKALAMGSGKCAFYGKVAVDFLHVTKKLFKSVTLCIFQTSSRWICYKM